jgi:molybdenum cofactor sulfurtransferase
MDEESSELLSIIDRFESVRAKYVSIESDVTYLDHAGCTLPRTDLIQSCMHDLMNGRIFGNPHTSGNHGQRTDDSINSARNEVLSFVNIHSEDVYDVIFTANSTAAAKLVAECFPWTQNSTYCYTANAHTSIVGMRAYAPNSICISSQTFQDSPNSSDNGNDAATMKKSFYDIKSNCECSYNLLSVPGECNFSGVKANFNKVDEFIDNIDNIDNIDQIKQNSSLIKGNYPTPSPESNTNMWLWLLDASKLASTSAIDLASIHADRRPHFVCLSFYKIFGYPTGLGALLVKRDIAHLLQKRWVIKN